MLVNSYEEKDYLKEMRDRVTFAFEDKPVFDKFLQLFADASLELQDAMRALMQDRSIDTAEGAQLDIIGNIVGQPRVLLAAEIMDYFGFNEVPTAQSFGDLNDPSAGGIWWDLNTNLAGDVELTDNQYRIFIKAKIMRDTTRATPEDIIEFIKFVFGAKVVQITSDGGAKQSLLIVGGNLSNFELTLLGYHYGKPTITYFLPKALGTEFAFGSVPGDNFFAYLGVPHADGYGTYDVDTGEVVGGGKYASVHG